MHTRKKTFFTPDRIKRDFASHEKALTWPCLHVPIAVLDAWKDVSLRPFEKTVRLAADRLGYTVGLRKNMALSMRHRPTTKE